MLLVLSLLSTHDITRRAARRANEGSTPRMSTSATVLAGRTTEGTPLLEARGLTVRFGKVTALAGLELTAPPGQVLAILGPNGAGKTTFVRTIATLIRPT